MTARLAETIWFLAAAGWFVLRLPHVRRARKTPVARSDRDSLERRLLGISLTGLGIVPILYIALSLIVGDGNLPFDRTFASWHGWVGLVCALAALALFQLTHAQLGRNWSVSLDTRRDHRLIDSGVYALVRHPMYSAFWLLAIAQAWLIPNWVAGFAGLIGFGTLFFLRVGREEQMMVDTFGEAYLAYMRRTKRVVPWLY
ncbi:MAG TPA: protein-S-isoprenylcysteine O-methyltransferase [Bauldia sp.]|nr:protein-S-isoprenylcysteine O-methyltransferase [Bauldia sp.]